MKRRTEPRRSALRRLFEDRSTGRIVVGQTPNLLAWILVASTVARFAAPAGSSGRTARSAQSVSLVLWSTDEALRGVNPFRRAGGALVLLSMLRRLRR